LNTTTPLSGGAEYFLISVFFFYKYYLDKYPSGAPDKGSFFFVKAAAATTTTTTTASSCYMKTPEIHLEFPDFLEYVGDCNIQHYPQHLFVCFLLGQYLVY